MEVLVAYGRKARYPQAHLGSSNPPSDVVGFVRSYTGKQGAFWPFMLLPFLNVAPTLSEMFFRFCFDEKGKIIPVDDPHFALQNAIIFLHLFSHQFLSFSSLRKYFLLLGPVPFTCSQVAGLCSDIMSYGHGLKCRWRAQSTTSSILSASPHRPAAPHEGDS